MPRSRFSDNIRRITDLIIQIQKEMQALEREKGVDIGLVQDAREVVGVLCETPGGSADTVMTGVPRDIDAIESFIARWSGNVNSSGMIRIARTLLAELKKLGKLWSESKESTRQQIEHGAQPGRKTAKWVLYWVVLAALGTIAFNLTSQLYLR